MSNPGDLRDILSAAHAEMAGLIGKTVDLYALDETTVVTNGTSLSAIVRGANHREEKWLASIGIKVDLVVEIPAQGLVDLSVLRPQKHKVKYGGVFWEIKSIQHDDLDTTTSEAPTASVWTLMCCRDKSGGIGEIAL